LEYNKNENKSENSSILLIGRFGFDARNLCYSKDFIYDEDNNKIFSVKYKKAKLEFLTAHSSKGLGYDNVIIVNARNEIYGFPAKIDDDPVLSYVVKDDKSIEYAEERRLFYVAMTRTKNRVFIVTPQQHPSEFILELIRDYPNVTVNGNINKEIIGNDLIKKCPVCGYPLQLRYKKGYGLKLWICSNEPEICNFITNKIEGGLLTIQKCDSCKDGYLIVKKSLKNDQMMLGCTNYRPDGTGCNRVMFPNEFFDKLDSCNFEEDISVDKPSYIKDIPLELPKVKPIEKSQSYSDRKKAEVHTTKRAEQFIEQDGFQVITDNEGQLLTDMELLKVLRALRTEIMKKENRPAYTIIGNKGLVSLATYRPETKEEFISLYGLGETTYSIYGIQFINAIKEYGKK
ncbi:MAG: HRDC domain-containing protein, partial [Clostridia bacterium]|nr:HRDC domain-containing protein [Clostridia bacterium]